MSGEESASATWHSVVDCSAVDSGEAYGAEINGQQIVIFHTEEGFFCTGNLCTHGEAMLSDGLLDGCIVECPLHFAQFDVRTGEALSSPAFIPVSSYPTRIVDEKVEILMPSGSVAKIVKLEHAWRRLDGRNDDGFQVAPFPG